MAAPFQLTAKHRRQLAAFAPDHLALIEKMPKPKLVAAEPPPIVEASTEMVIDLRRYTERLTVGDMEDIEAETGMSMSEIFISVGKGSAAGMAAIIWGLQRKADPLYTLEQARSLPLSKLVAAINRSNRKEADESPLGATASPTA